MKRLLWCDDCAFADAVSHGCYISYSIFHRASAHCREVAKAVKLRKAKTVVVAPNIEQIESEGGLDDLLGSILKQADEFGLPVVFALSRKKMGQVSSLSSCLCAWVCESVVMIPFAVILCLSEAHALLLVALLLYLFVPASVSLCGKRALYRCSVDAVVELQMGLLVCLSVTLSIWLLLFIRACMIGNFWCVEFDQASSVNQGLGLHIAPSAVLCCAVLCCAVLCCAVLCCAVLCCTSLIHTLLLYDCLYLVS